jgi:predicted DNA-binding protein (UPF0251 family)
MGRPLTCRRVRCRPHATIFKPAGIPLVNLATVTLAMDELEALRLADLETLYQEDAAARMRISRSTFARVLDAARRKVADSLVNGRAIVIEGGPVHFPGERCCCATRRGREGQAFTNDPDAATRNNEEK